MRLTGPGYGLDINEKKLEKHLMILDLRQFWSSTCEMLGVEG